MERSASDRPRMYQYHVCYGVRGLTAFVVERCAQGYGWRVQRRNDGIECVVPEDRERGTRDKIKSSLWVRRPPGAALQSLSPMSRVPLVVITGDLPPRMEALPFPPDQRCRPVVGAVTNYVRRKSHAY
jgi:hypothetical protein